MGSGVLPLAITTRPCGGRKVFQQQQSVLQSIGCCWLFWCCFLSLIFACSFLNSRLYISIRGLLQLVLQRVLPAPRVRERIKPIERLGPVSCTHHCASTSGLSTWWSSTALKGKLVLRGASRLDAFSGYPVRT